MLCEIIGERILKRSVLFPVCLLAVLWLGVVQAGAQSTLNLVEGEIVHKETVTTSDSEDAPKKPEPQKAASWSGVLDSTIQALSREGLTNDDLDKHFNEAGRIIAETNAKILEVQPRVTQLSQQLEEIGPSPAEGEPAEAEDISARRKLLNEQFAEEDGKLKEARLALVRAQQLQKSIASNRRARFVRALTARSDDPVDAAFWGKFLSGFEGFSRSFALLFRDSFSVVSTTNSLHTWKKLALPILLFLIFFVLVYLRRKVVNFGASLNLPEENTDVVNPVRGFFEFCRVGIFGALIPVILYLALSKFGLLTARLELFFREIIISLAFVILAVSLAIVILAPSDNRKRIAKLSDATAGKVFHLLVVGLAVASVFRIMNVTSVVLVSPFEVSFGFSIFTSVAVSAFGLCALWLIARDRVDGPVYSDPQQRVVSWRYLRMFVWLAIGVTIVAVLSGYVALAEFLSLQLIFGSVVLGTVWLLLRMLEALQAGALNRPTEDAQDQTSESEATSLGQMGVLGFGMIKLLVYVAAVVLLLLPWGYQTSDFFRMISKVFFGFQIGGLSFSLSTILMALALFAVGYTVTIALRGWLNNRLLPTTNLDIGVSNSISTIFGYFGFTLAAVLAITAAGFDLSNLAIVAGALSLGVGFGLQSIVSNFVSGLILLTERPIAAGDWVVTTGGEGTVKRISVRSTEIQTFDRASVIVPNSTLITDPVTNWTRQNKMGRIIVPIGVGYNSDPDQVRDILLNCADKNSGILRRPAPIVYLMDFGADALVFQLRAFLADINYSVSVQSELRFAILKALRAAKIEIPFPQRDVHIKSGDLPLPKPASRTTGKTTRKKPG